ncbi:MAG: RnfABCDGE type electron transport complex subunit G [Caldithrix sp.]|nr:RnfABCDGE type electron transport complex subunit G [Caldithrix sp.]
MAKQEESGLKIILVLVLIAGLAAVLLAYVNKVTSGPIAEKKRQETQRAIKVVMANEAVQHPEMPEPVKQVDFPAEYFPVRNQADQPLGYAFKVEAPDGFTSAFEILVGVDTTGKIVDTYVLSHKETPGLGDGMMEEEFKKQFRGRSLDNTNWSVQKDGGDIDAITAATITSRAFTYGAERALRAYETLKEDQ